MNTDCHTFATSPLCNDRRSAGRTVSVCAAAVLGGDHPGADWGRVDHSTPQNAKGQGSGRELAAKTQPGRYYWSVNENGHNLDRLLESLWQCLSQSKRPLGLMLGAGCPVSIKIPDGDGSTHPLIPDIAGLTEAINETLSNSVLKDDHARLLEGLTEDFQRPPNIEEVLTRLRTLATIAGVRSVRGLNSSSIALIERAVTDAITSKVSVPLPLPPTTPYDDVSVWVRSASRSSPVRIFTTNYDLLLEAALERNGVPFFDGFIGVTEPFLDTETTEMDDLPPRWARLWKLHGSINWTLLTSGSVVRREATADEGQRLIHPSHLKYEESRRMPYLVMFDQLRDFLKSVSATLIVLGYSFGDEHVNDLLVQGLRGNPSAKIFGLQHSQLACYPYAYDIAKEYPNLSLLASDGAVAAGRRAMWQPLADGKARTCDLGDFLQFGAYLRKLVGRSAGASGLDEGADENADAI